MDKQKEIKEFLAFIVQEAKSKGKDPNTYVKELGEDGMKEAYKRYLAKKEQSKKEEIKKALHGAKLNYFKSLKHQCADDEELYYYKKGGSVGCGCKKKEDGGEIKKSLSGWKVKFQNRDSVLVDKDKIYDPKTKQFRPKTKEDEKKWKKNLKDAKEGKGEGTPPNINKGINKNACGGSALKMKNHLPPKKVKEEKCGGAVKKFKKHHLGGSLNGIPFMQAGTPKGGLPTAPKAEDRYKGGTKEITIVHPYDVTKFGFRGTQPIRKVNSGSASISEIIRDAKDGTPADTMYYEIPNHLPFVNVQPRYSFSYGNLSSKYGFNPEFNILKRRFNTAWNLAK